VKIKSGKSKLFHKKCAYVANELITKDNLNPNVIETQYAVRGPIVMLAQDLEKQGKEIYYFNIGNPQQLGQKPLTYVREVLSLLQFPKLISESESTKVFSNYALEKAKFILQENPIGMGAYTQSAGMPFIREAVAKFISKRDNIQSSADNIFLTDGASKGVDLTLQSIIRNKTDGILVPIPQYPLYSADIVLFGGQMVPYFLDEKNNFSLNTIFLNDSIQKAKNNGITARAIVVINPSNPTGSLLSIDNMKDIISFAYANRLAIIADEVYQENIYNPNDKFVSFAKVLNEMDYKIPLFSLHSTSKGFIGECGQRGGYIEMRNIDPEVRDILLKIRSIGLCANTSGQIMTYLMVNPPEEGDDSYELYQTERSSILSSLARKAKSLSIGLNKIDGITCQTPPGAMYLFPKLDFPADKDYENKPPDFQFCKQLVLEEGIVTVPGSGFGQSPGTFHLRMTILPKEDDIPKILEKFERCYKRFVSS
jgi:aspartate/methionine/tyrosine aminotransferase